MAVVLNIISRFDNRGVASAQKSLQKFGSASRGFAGSTSADLVRAGASLDNVGKKAIRTGKSLTLGVSLPIAGIGALAYRAGLDFDLSMRQVQAASGASVQDMAALERQAKQFGYTTVFSAQEAAGAMLALAKSGITPAQIKAGALKATLDLAAAGELDLTTAAETTSNALNAFGLKASDAGKVADALAGAANASSANVSDLTQALAQSSAIASAMGYSLNETSGALALFANRGILGSDAGTSLKTMMARLIPTTDKAKTLFKRFGLDFTDAKGRMIPLTKVAQQLQDKLGGLTVKQRSAALSQIFGSDAMRAATVMTQAGAKGLGQYITATKDKTAAEKMAAAMTESDRGQIDKMRATVSTAAIDIQTALAPAVNAAAGKIGDLARAFGRMPAGTQKVVGSIALAAAATGPLIIGFGAVARGAGSLLKVTGNIGIAFGENAAKAPRYARAIAGITKGAGAAAKAIGQGVVWMGRQAVASAVSTAKLVAHTAAVVASRVAALAVAGASKAWAAAQWILNAAMSANPIGIVVVAIAAFVAAVVIAWKKSETFRRVITGAWTAIKTATLAVFNGIASFFRSWGPKIVAVLLGPIGGLAIGIVRHWRQIKDGAVSAFSAVVSFAREIPGKIKAAVGNLGRLLYDAGTQIVRGLLNGIENAWHWITDKISSLVDGLGSTAKKLLGINSPSRVFAEIGKGIGEGLVVGIDSSRALVAAASGRLAGVATFAGGSAADAALAGGYSGAGGRGAVSLSVVVQVDARGSALTESQITAATHAGADPALERVARELRRIAK